MNSLAEHYDALPLQDYLLGGAKLVLFVVILAISWAAINKLTKFDDHHEMYVKANAALAWRRGGLVVGQGLAMTSLLAMNNDVWWVDFAWLVGGGIWAIVLLAGFSLVTRPIGDSLAASIVRAAFYAAGGYVVSASFTGDAPTYGTGVASALTFTVLGLAVLVGVYAFNSVLPRYRLHSKIRQDNVAAALVASGFVIGLGLVLHNAIAGDFVGWGPAFVGFAVTFVVAMVLFYVLDWAVDKWVFTHATLREIVAEKQTVPAATLAVFQVVIALAITSLPIW